MEMYSPHHLLDRLIATDPQGDAVGKLLNRHGHLVIAKGQQDGKDRPHKQILHRLPQMCSQWLEQRLANEPSDVRLTFNRAPGAKATILWSLLVTGAKPNGQPTGHRAMARPNGSSCPLTPPCIKGTMSHFFCTKVWPIPVPEALLSHIGALWWARELNRWPLRAAYSFAAYLTPTDRDLLRKTARKWGSKPKGSDDRRDSYYKESPQKAQKGGERGLHATMRLGSSLLKKACHSLAASGLVVLSMGICGKWPRTCPPVEADYDLTHYLDTPVHHLPDSLRQYCLLTCEEGFCQFWHWPEYRE